MSEIEESLMHYNGEDISGKIIKSRKELLKLQSCYYQLMDLGEKLKETNNIFVRFTKKLERLLSEARDLREYSLQIRELYQTQIAVRQNKIMQLLTMVTTIFMPLTLLTGWYGMNFNQMPETAWKYGYPAVALLALILILLEIWFFKRRKWFL
jgi:magnesium transporter